jgi:hypothetical protein
MYTSAVKTRTARGSRTSGAPLVLPLVLLAILRNAAHLRMQVANGGGRTRALLLIET